MNPSGTALELAEQTWWSCRLPAALSELHGRLGASRSTNMEHDMDTNDEHRQRMGAALRALEVQHCIEGYYFARGDWHITTNEGRRLVIPASRVANWVEAAEAATLTEVRR